MALTPRQGPICPFSRSSYLACRISPNGKKMTPRAMIGFQGFFDRIPRTALISVSATQSRLFMEMCGRRFLRLLGPGRSSQARSLLLQLPVELLLDISDLLPPQAAVAFALTCTSLFGTLFPKNRLHPDQVGELLKLLERDLSKQLFYCQRCNILHHFSPSWGPGRQDSFAAPCKPKVEVPDTFQLDFRFARLAMNKHLLGGGIKLEQLTCTFPAYCRGWYTSFTARVIQDELYLSVLHTLSLDRTGFDNRHELEHSHHGICNHVTTHRPRIRFNLYRPPRGTAAYRQWLQEGAFNAVPQRTRIPALAPRKLPSYSYALTECRDAQGFCPVCLTDYSITTNQKKSSDVSNGTTKETWSIVIVAYHQLGPCRSQSDWKWLTYATQLPDFCRKKDMDASLLGKRQKNGPYAPGSVQARWNRG